MKRLFKICIAVVLLFALSAMALPVSAEKLSQGDANGDGKVTAVDYSVVKRSVLRSVTLTEDQKRAADVNGDGSVNAIDYVIIKRVVLKAGKFPCLHDYDETVVGNLHIYTCKSCGHQYEKFDGELIG